MKKLILFSYLAVSSSFIHGQTNTFPATGNVGIGVINPTEKLNISAGTLLFSGEYGNFEYGSIKFSYPAWPAAWAGITAKTNGQGWDQVDLIFNTAFGGSTEKMRIMSQTGNVGIGTSMPNAKLDVRGSVSIGSNRLITVNPDYTGSGELPSGSYIGTNGVNSVTVAPSTDVAAVGAKVVLGYASTNWWSALEVANVASGYSNLLLMKSGGKVGIGTSTPNANASLDVNGNIFTNSKIAIGITDMNKIGDYSLAVNGSAIFTRAVVKQNSAWPDYVFAPNYQMPRLDSLEKFIKTNGHLPEIPKAEDIKKNGIDLGDNQALLLKKIEELTLIVIEQNKRIEKLEKENQLKEKK